MSALPVASLYDEACTSRVWCSSRDGAQLSLDEKAKRARLAFRVLDGGPEAARRTQQRLVRKQHRDQRAAAARQANTTRTAIGGIVLVLCASIVAAMVLIGASVARANEFDRFALVPSRTVVVDGGDSLWSIAAGCCSEGRDIYDTMHVIERINGIESSAPLLPGMVLSVPAE